VIQGVGPEFKSQYHGKKKADYCILKTTLLRYNLFTIHFTHSKYINRAVEPSPQSSSEPFCFIGFLGGDVGSSLCGPQTEIFLPLHPE
jgi:hypothetical protein